MPNEPAPNPVPAPTPTPIAAEAPAPKPANVLSDGERLAQLARKEQAIRAQSKKIQEERKAFEQERAKYVPISEYKAKLMQDPQSMGISAEELSQLTLTTLNQDPQSQMLRQMQNKIAFLESKLAENDNKFESTQKSAYDQALKQVAREVNRLVDSGDAYETIKTTKNYDAVVSLIEETYKDEGVLLSAEEAAKQVEDYLLEQAITVARLKKVQDKLAPPPTQPSTEASTKSEPTKQPTTLTNAMSQSSKTLTEKERRERAIAAFESARIRG